MIELRTGSRESSVDQILRDPDRKLSELYPSVYDAIVAKLAATRGETVDFQNAKQAVRILRDLLGSIQDGTRRLERVPIAWTHQRPIDVHSSMKNYEINVQQLLEAVSRYRQHDWMHSDHLDWLCADVVIWSCYRESILNEFWALEGVWGVFFHSDVDRSRLQIIGWQITAWVAFCFGLYFVYRNYPVWAAAALLTVAAAWQSYRLRMKWKAVNQLEPVIRVYNCLRGNDVAWNVVRREMEDARRNGVQWPGETWRLVEDRCIEVPSISRAENAS